ncbi:hypothetical protein GW923_04155 [Candidatus Pacearchaeota archaeon]|nr:hypothetical protein [Candidatus Pacearchaeota archaeon]
MYKPTEKRAVAYLSVAITFAGITDYAIDRFMEHREQRTVLRTSSLENISEKNSN